MSALIERARVVAIARDWLGTPYHHQASLKGVGTDCIGLVRGVYRELYDHEAQDVPPYSADWGDAHGNEDLLEAGRRYLVEIPVGDAQFGDVVAVRWLKSGVAKHAVLISSPNTMIHAYNGADVCEVHISDWWRRKFVAAFSYPGARV